MFWSSCIYISMEQRPSWETDSCWVRQKSFAFWNLNVLYFVHKSATVLNPDPDESILNSCTQKKSREWIVHNAIWKCQSKTIHIHTFMHAFIQILNICLTSQYMPQAWKIGRCRLSSKMGQMTIITAVYHVSWSWPMKDVLSWWMQV